MKYLLIYSLIMMYSGGESVRSGERGPMELEACKTMKAEMEAMKYPFIGKYERLVITCEPVKENL